MERVTEQQELWTERKIAPKDAIDRYAAHLQGRRAASPHTVSNYRIDLDHFFRFLSESGQLGRWRIAMAQEKTFRDFLAEQEAKYSRATVLRRLGALKSFLRFLRERGILDRNVAKLLRVSPGTAAKPEVPDEESVQKLLDHLPSKTLRDKRIRAAAELIYSAGLRVSEVVALDTNSLDFDAGTAKVRKGGPDRSVPLGRPCRRAVRDYLDSLPSSQRRKGTAPLFLNRDGERVSVRTLQRDLLAAAKNTLGDDAPALTPHRLRHACATHLIRRGASVQAVRALLGHKALLTTQKYTEDNFDQLDANYRKFHPAAQEKPTPRPGRAKKR